MSMIVPLLALLTVQSHPVAQIDSIISNGIERGVYPGAVAVIGTADTTFFLRGFGGLTWRADAETPEPDSTLYDLASLTKIIATTAAVMRLVDNGVVDLDERVQRYVPDFVGDNKRNVKVRDLLAHTSGLRAFLPLNESAADAAEARHQVVTEALRWDPGRRAEYSDLNAMLLAWVVEGATNTSFADFVRDSVHLPLGMSQTQFRLPRSLRYRTAPINRWRGTPIVGVVHDQNAEKLGGVAGHAGLYSTGADLARYASTILSWGVTPRGEQVFSPEVVDQFLTRQGGNRALGFEANDTTSSGHTGDSLSARAVGHGGYTGSSIWIDPGQNIFVILLTNRVYAPKTGRSISHLRGIRGDLADAAVRLRNHYCRLLTETGQRENLGCLRP
jgi:CubicO group peptidase (beta-lactamase class C family)